jgi:hypothetical protein
LREIGDFSKEKMPSTLVEKMQIIKRLSEHQNPAYSCALISPLLLMIRPLYPLERPSGRGSKAPCLMTVSDLVDFGGWQHLFPGASSTSQYKILRPAW